MNMPRQPYSSLGKLQPKKMDIDHVKRKGWQKDGILVIDINNPKLSWPDRELLKQIGNRFYGQSKINNSTMRQAS